jgi:hypothetical protein
MIGWAGSIVGFMQTSKASQTFYAKLLRMSSNAYSKATGAYEGQSLV